MKWLWATHRKEAVYTIAFFIVLMSAVAFVFVRFPITSFSRGFGPEWSCFGPTSAAIACIKEPPTASEKAPRTAE
jgi:hypothetical protein